MVAASCIRILIAIAVVAVYAVVCVGGGGGVGIVPRILRMVLCRQTLHRAMLALMSMRTASISVLGAP